jgi:hypothetical protein
LANATVLTMNAGPAKDHERRRIATTPNAIASITKREDFNGTLNNCAGPYS